jgi:hypothetical protein
MYRCMILCFFVLRGFTVNAQTINLGGNTENGANWIPTETWEFFTRF